MLKDQRIIWGVGAVVMVALAVVFGLLAGGRSKTAPAPSTQAGLQFSDKPQPPLNAAKPLRCFVNGQFVGMLSLADCAQKNGVSAQALDVGVDANGSVTAAPSASLAPPPAAPQAPAAQAAPSLPDAPAGGAADQGPPGACMRFAGGEWRTVSDGMSQNACLKALFAGRCLRPGEAEYGHWGEMTVRLVFPSQVQISSDNRSFRTVYDQGRACEGALAH